MAQIHGKAGEWARVKGSVVGLWPLFIGVFALGFTLSVAFFVAHGLGAVLVVFTLLWCARALFKGLRHVERFFKGALGEEKVSRLLAALPDAYHVFNDFLAGGVHVDHVVVGPTGVFAVETKSWRGQVMLEQGYILINGQLPSRPPLVQARKEADLVRSELAVKGWDGGVGAILAFADDNFNARGDEAGGVVVLNARDLNSSFCGGRTVLSESEIARLVGLMES